MIFFADSPMMIPTALREKMNLLKFDLYCLESSSKNTPTDELSFPYVRVEKEVLMHNLNRFINASFKAKRAAVISLSDFCSDIPIIEESLKKRQLWDENNLWCLLTPRSGCYIRIYQNTGYKDTNEVIQLLKKWEKEA